jgi:hypothetical protein
MLILGAWGVVTEIISVFSGKPIFSYRGVILAFLLDHGAVLQLCGRITCSRPEPSSCRSSA